MRDDEDVNCKSLVLSRFQSFITNAGLALIEVEGNALPQTPPTSGRPRRRHRASSSAAPDRPQGIRRPRRVSRVSNLHNR